MKKSDDNIALIFGIVTVVLILITILAGAGDEPDYYSAPKYHSTTSYTRKTKNTTNTTSTTSTTNTTGSTSKTTSSNKTTGSTGTNQSYHTYNPYGSYDKGYEDVMEDDDYDWDRYYSDDDYADGVDDALDESDW